MRIGFTPCSTDDWRLLLRLAQCMRLASKSDIERVVALFDAHGVLLDDQPAPPGEEVTHG